jgi:peptidoglycan/xylan/chitin deacetylase (PgdA/CDA1 family)
VTRVRRRTFVGLGAAAAAGAGIAAAGGVGLGRRVEGAVAESREELDGYAAAPSRPMPSGVRHLVWSVATTERAVAFTFDDGPDPEFTPRVLEVLRRYGIKASFHLLGFNALNHPDEVRAVVAAGHEIGNHTFTHQDLAYETPAGTLLQLQRGRQSILDVAGAQPLRWFRPPRGRLTGVAIRYAAELGHDVVLWSTTTGGREHPDDIRAYLHRRLHPGAIVALHDGIGRGTFLPSAAFARELATRREAELRALPSVIEQALEDGYRFVTVSQLVELDQAWAGGSASELAATGPAAPASSA